MSFKLGSQITIVVSSPTIAKEILQKNDQLLSSRTIPQAAYAHNHHDTSIVWLPASSRWRNLRKLCKEHVFSAARLDASQELRQEKMKELGEYLYNCSVKGQVVRIGEAAFMTTLNLISSSLFSANFVDIDHNSSQELKQVFTLVMQNLGKPNIADYFPALSYIDPQGIFGKVKLYFGKMFDIFDNFIEQRLQERSSGQSYSRKQDLLEALLDQMSKEDSEFKTNHLKDLFLDLFVAGTDTTALTVEWAMAELLHKPEKMAKAKAELIEVTGQKKIIEESDISRLPYLQALVKETFRLHPPGVFLVPRKAEANVEIDGYIVPKDANIWINIWATGRDSETWSKAEEFLPERFLGSEIDVRGQHFELLPFGGGRRICPGLPLAYRMLHLILALLIRDFDWKLEEGMRHEDIDMEEHFGLTIEKATPLKAIPVKQ